METTPAFFWHLMNQLNPEVNADMIYEVQEITKKLGDLQRATSVPVETILTIYLPHLEVIMNEIQDFSILRPDVAQYIVGIWRSPPGQEGYEQVFPHEEKEDESQPNQDSQENGE